MLCDLIRLADISKVEAGRAVGRVRRHARHPALVALAAVRRVALVPDVDRDVLSLHTQGHMLTSEPRLVRTCYGYHLAYIQLNT